MIVGTAGHIDHGKTSLVKALTGVDTDRLKEEKARGITIDLGFAYRQLADGSVMGFVDVPGHERFVPTMLAGAHGIDFVVLVIAADDGVMPQTREHLQVLDLLGLDRGLVALTKADLVDADMLVQRELEIAELLAGTSLAGAEVFPVSTVTDAGVADLLDRLEAEAGEDRARDAGRGFRLAVDRSFTLQGAGTVVTGTVLGGRVAVGDTAVLSPAGLTVRVRSIHAQNRKAETAVAGDRAALNLVAPGLSKDTIRRGDMILAPSLHAPTLRIDAELRVLPSEPKPIQQWMPVRLHHGAVSVGARIVLLGDAPGPGETADVQLVLERPIAATARDRFVLRDVSESRNIGGGRFLDLRAPERRRRTEERARIRDAWRQTDDGAALAALLAEPPGFVDLTGFLADRGLDPASAEALAAAGALALFTLDGRLHAVRRDRLDTLGAEIEATLGAYHRDNPDEPGMGFERLRQQTAARVGAPLYRALLRRYQDAGLIATEGAWVRLASHKVELTPEDEALWDEIRPLISGEARFRPPRVRDIAHALELDEDKVRRLMRRMQRAARVDEVALDHFFMRGTVAEIVAIAREIADAAPGGWFNAATLRDRLDNGRKVAIQILEFLDRHGVTLRRGDLRRLNPHRQDLFRLDVDAPQGGESSPVGRPDFKSGWGRETVPGGFDSHSPPPIPARERAAR